MILLSDPQLLASKRLSIKNIDGQDESMLDTQMGHKNTDVTASKHCVYSQSIGTYLLYGE